MIRSNAVLTIIGKILLALFFLRPHTPAAVTLHFHHTVSLSLDDRTFDRLEQLITKLTTNIEMKLSEIKAAVAEAAKDNAEAFGEIGTKIAELQQKIDDLIAGNSDPDVTDEDFLADLESLKVSAQGLADIVPAPAEPPVDPDAPPADPNAVAGSDRVRRTN